MSDGTRYQQLLARHLAMNAESWAALQRHGVTPTTELRLDFAYDAPGEREAAGLRALLAEQTDYDVEVASDGLPFRKRWRVTGSTQPTAVDREILDSWVDWMIAAGLEHGCEFDGWGAAVPPFRAG